MVVSTNLKNISQVGSVPQIGVRITKYLKAPPGWGRYLPKLFKNTLPETDPLVSGSRVIPPTTPPSQPPSLKESTPPKTNFTPHVFTHFNHQPAHHPCQSHFSQMPLVPTSPASWSKLPIQNHGKGSPGGSYGSRLLMGLGGGTS